MVNIIQFDTNHQLFKKLDESVSKYLSKNGKEILAWLTDSLHLLDYLKRQPIANFYDYSFVVTPAFKALEKWLLVIAPSLGVPSDIIKKAEETGRLSLFLKDDQIDKFFGAVIKKLDIESQKKHRLKTSVETLNANLKNFRHTPAHCSNTIDNIYQADTTINQIVGSINDLTRSLIDDGVIHIVDGVVSSR